MKAMRIGGALLAAAFLLAAAGAASAAPRSDRDTLAGTWFVAQGIYADGSVEKELEMQFAFMKTTMTSPMGEGELGYALDEKAKVITAKDARNSVWIRYAVVDAVTVKFVEMKVTTPKGVTVIVGDSGTFKELDLKKKI